MEQIRCNNLSIGYGERAIASGLSFSVNAGDYLCIVGENGAGKSTLMLFLLLYNRLFALTFDENFARVCGISVEFYNLLLAIIIAVIIVLAMNLVGALLVSALIIFPTMAAMRLFESFRAVTAASAAISVSCALIGILVSVLAGTPVGSTIVVADALAFGLSVIAARLRGGV